jgi:hypothetical protein
MSLVIQAIGAAFTQAEVLHSYGTYYGLSRSDDHVELLVLSVARFSIKLASIYHDQDNNTIVLEDYTETEKSNHHGRRTTAYITPSATTYQVADPELIPKLIKIMKIITQGMKK